MPHLLTQPPPLPLNKAGIIFVAYIRFGRSRIEHKEFHIWFSLRLMSTSSGHAPNGRRHVVSSAVSLADVYSSPAKPVLVGTSVRVAGCRLSLRLID